MQDCAELKRSTIITHTLVFLIYNYISSISAASPTVAPFDQVGRCAEVSQSNDTYVAWRGFVCD